MCDISGKRVPSSSIFSPIKGDGTKLEIWSFMSIRLPAEKSDAYAE